MASIPSPSRLHDNELSLLELWQLLRKQWRWVTLHTLIGGLTGAGIAYLSTPLYRAEVVVAVTESSAQGAPLGALASQLGGLAGLAGVSLGGSSSRAEALGTLGSRQLLETYIASNKLLPQLFDQRWDEGRQDWRPSMRKTPTVWDGTQRFIKDIRQITEDRKSGLVTLSVEWKDAATAARWANDLVQLANQTLRQRAISQSETNLTYLHAQLEKTSVVELRQAIYRLIETEVKSVMVAQGSQEYAFKVIDPATTPEKPHKPNKILITFTGLALGFLLATWILFAKRKINH